MTRATGRKAPVSWQWIQVEPEGSVMIHCSMRHLGQMMLVSGDTQYVSGAPQWRCKPSMNLALHATQAPLIMTECIQVPHQLSCRDHVSAR